MRDRQLAIQAIWELRHSNRAAAKAIINLIRESEYDDKKVNGYYDNIWGAIYPDDPQGWEYPGQIVRHVRCVVDELNEAKAVRK